MGNQKRRPLAPAAAAVPATKNVTSNGMNDTVPSVKRTTPIASRTQHPTSSYQLYNLRATINADPQTQIVSFIKSLHVSSNTTSGAIPIVLDMSAFHPDGSPHYTPPAQGTLAAFVSAIQSTNSMSLVGVTNLPHAERKGQLSSMAVEAQALNLPVMQPVFHTSFVPEMKLTAGNAVQQPIRKKRGGVAPLLRPRRPVAGNSTPVLDTSEIDTREVIKNSIQNAIAAAPRTESHPSTKVHKGSIRSGQLVTSDYPNQSLVIIGSINPGGEVWSEGDVFVFGKLRGRVLAGLQNVGDKTEQIGNRPVASDAKQNSRVNSDDMDSKSRQSSRIFATSFDPELICIGDTFTTIDDVGKLGLCGVGPAIVFLNGNGELSFESFVL